MPPASLDLSSSHWFLPFYYSVLSAAPHYWPRAGFNGSLVPPPLPRLITGRELGSMDPSSPRPFPASLLADRWVQWIPPPPALSPPHYWPRAGFNGSLLPPPLPRLIIGRELGSMDPSSPRPFPASLLAESWIQWIPPPPAPSPRHYWPRAGFNGSLLPPPLPRLITGRELGSMDPSSPRPFPASLLAESWVQWIPPPPAPSPRHYWPRAGFNGSLLPPPLPRVITGRELGSMDPSSLRPFPASITLKSEPY